MDSAPQPAPLSPHRRLRRLLVRLRTWTGLIPMLLLVVYGVVMLGLAQVADGWIVALAATPLLFALLLAAGCWLAYRRDFYA